MAGKAERELGNRIKTIREHRGLTLKQLAERAGIDKSQISRYESGERLPLPLALVRIAEGLGVVADALLPGDSIVWNVVRLDVSSETESLQDLCSRSSRVVMFSRFSPQDEIWRSGEEPLIRKRRETSLPNWMQPILDEGSPALACMIWREEELVRHSEISEDFLIELMQARRLIHLAENVRRFDSAVQVLAKDLEHKRWQDVSVFDPCMIVVTHCDHTASYGWDHAKAQALISTGMTLLEAYRTHLGIESTQYDDPDVVARLNAFWLQHAQRLYDESIKKMHESIRREIKRMMDRERS